MTSRSLGLFDQGTRQRDLQALRDSLVALNTIVPWGVFRVTLESMRNEGRSPRKGGRPPHDALRTLKVLVLRDMYALSDEQVNGDALISDGVVGQDRTRHRRTPVGD